MTTLNLTHENSGIQAGDVFGDLTINQQYPPRSGLLRAAASEGELDAVRHRFVEPEGMERARQVLAEWSVVVLQGLGAGRTFTALRLLTESRCSRIIHLNPARSLGSVDGGELHEGEGYVWADTDPGSAELTEAGFDHVHRLARARKARLVILLDRPTWAPPPNAVAELKPPNPLDVARAVIHAKHPGAERLMAELDGPLAGTLTGNDPPQKAVHVAELVLDGPLAGTLTGNDSPQKAVHVAELAMEIAYRGLDPAEALAELDDNADRAVENTIKAEWSAVEYTLMIAVAVLEGRPYDQVAFRAEELDASVRQAELPEGASPAPRPVFAKSRDKMLDEIKATTDLRNHPRHPGLREYTVRFIRPGWSAAVLKRFWQQYHLEHRMLVNWMCRPGFRDEAVKALCTVIGEVPMHEPLRELERLAASNKIEQRHVAVSTLIRLADDRRLRPLVEQTLDRWVQSGTPNRKATAALVYGRGLGRMKVKQTLVKLGEIGRDGSPTVGKAVIAAVLGLLGRPEHRAATLGAVVSWVADLRSLRAGDGLCPLALELGMWILGARTEPAGSPVDPASLSAGETAQVEELVWKLAIDRQHGPELLSRMDELASARGLMFDETERDDVELLRLATLVAPDLHSWWARQWAVVELGRHHPESRATIRRIFRTARKIQREQGIPATR